MSADMEAILRSAAADAAWPPTPNLRAAVMARIEADQLLPAGRDGGVVAGRRPIARFGRALALAFVALLLLAGLATALGYRLPGLDILFVERLTPAGSGLDLGSPIGIGEARSLDRPHVLVPSELPAPDAAYLLGAGNRAIVTLAYRADAGEPTLAGSDLSLLVMAAPGSTDEGMLAKVIGPGTTLEPVSVGGARGWWIGGAPHEILIRRPGGDVGVQSAALAGDTLVFVRDGTLYRLESALGREATIAIAESMD